MRRRVIFGLACAAAALSGCEQKFVADLSAEPAYRPVIGAQYEVISEVIAYGITLNLNRRFANFVTLMPPPGIGGPEVAFEKRLVPGSTITVLRVMKTNRWPDPDVTLFVRLDGTPMPVDAPVLVDLFRGNEGKGRTLLNPAVYRRRP